MTFKKTLLVLAIAAASTAALADIKIGVSLALTGPGSGLGIPMQKQLELFPKTIGGEKIILEILDDATDPGKGAANARRFVTEDKVDVIFGSCITAWPPPVWFDRPPGLGVLIRATGSELRVLKITTWPDWNDCT